MLLKPSARRATAAALVALALAQPAAAEAQAVTYRFTGTADFGGQTLPVELLLGGDAANAEAITNGAVVTGYRNAGLSLTFGPLGLPLIVTGGRTLINTLVPVAGQFPAAGLYAVSPVGAVEFFLTGAGLSGLDLGTLAGPVAVDFYAPLFQPVGAPLPTTPDGSGTFEIVAAAPPVSTVPEPGTWALLGTGLLAVGAAARRRAAPAATRANA